ncbi:MAG TPA: hypothetical protein VFL76_08305 [Edaphocola sp.]|nr:hypothetical protein [Edaphocola sp.]
MILLQHIEQIIRDYSGGLPLHHYLKNFFRTHPKLGSRDRKAINDAVYAYYRTAPFSPRDAPVFAVIQKGLAILKTQNVFLKKIIEQDASQDENALSLSTVLARKHIPLSQGMDEEEWLLAHMQQPDLFVRIVRNTRENLQKLTAKGISYNLIEPAYHKTGKPIHLRLPNGSKIDQYLNPEDYVVQDLSTQAAVWKAAAFRSEDRDIIQVWDTCAGAGGKTILWKELFPRDKILATDIRQSILHNLKVRSALYHLSGIKTMIANAAANEIPINPQKPFDAVICDVPCSGSGTWGRTPEQFYFFEEKDLKKFKALQWPIVQNASRFLKPGGLLFYITCSVFACENEAVIHQLQQNTSMTLLHQELINGIAHRADSIFMAVLRKA